MIPQRSELALRIGMFVANITCRPGDDRRWSEIVIANAATRPTLWTQSGPMLRVNWEGRHLLSPQKLMNVISITLSQIAGGVGEMVGDSVKGWRTHWNKP